MRNCTVKTTIKQQTGKQNRHLLNHVRQKLRAEMMNNEKLNWMIHIAKNAEKIQFSSFYLILYLKNSVRRTILPKRWWKIAVIFSRFKLLLCATMRYNMHESSSSVKRFLSSWLSMTKLWSFRAKVYIESSCRKYAMQIWRVLRCCGWDIFLAFAVCVVKVSTF